MVFGGRFRVSYRAEIPFIFGLACVFGMWTRINHNLMVARRAVGKGRTFIGICRHTWRFEIEGCWRLTSQCSCFAEADPFIDGKKASSEADALPEFDFSALEAEEAAGAQGRQK